MKPLILQPLPMSDGVRPRLHLLDTLRGVTILSMIAFHAAWDAKNLLGLRMPWFTDHLGHITDGAYIWQQSICWTFILLSGLCYPLSRSHLRRGLTVFGAGLLVMLATHLFMPDDAITFGVLTLHGSAMLLFIPIDILMGQARKKRRLGIVLGALLAILSAALFVVTRDVSDPLRRSLGFEGLGAVPLPKELYEGGLLGAYLGFPPAGFSSSDYFPLIPWVFLFGVGYFLSPFLIRKEKPARILCCGVRPLSFVGRHALLIYLLHQPILALLCTIVGQL